MNWEGKDNGGNQLITDVRDWAIKAHVDTNHFYDVSLPYSFHLNAVNREIYNYLHLIVDPDITIQTKRRIDVICAGWLHDCVEDARKSYNDVLQVSNINVAEMVRAVTNYGRGRNRAERMPHYIYDEIANTGDADVLKCADRIANIKYSIFMESTMRDKYRREHEEFISRVTNRPKLLNPMVDKLTELVCLS